MAGNPTSPNAKQPKPDHSKGGQQPGSSASRNLTPKQQAAAARAEAEAAERRRERTIRIVGGVLVLLVVGGLLAVGLLAGQDSDQTAQPPDPDANAALPTGVQSDTFGVPYGTGWTSPDAAKLPTLALWEDFQCPACKALEDAAGMDIRAVAEEGLVKLLYRPTTFLDRAHPESQNASARATSAWGCAIDAGHTGDYHAGVFAMQPADEGQGYTDDQLKALGSQVGIEEGDQRATFERCVDDGTYLAWSANGYEKFVSEEVGGTPTATLNGTELDNSDVANPDTLRQLISDATAK